MSVKNESVVGGESVVLERPETGGVYASLFEKIHLNPVDKRKRHFSTVWQILKFLRG